MVFGPLTAYASCKRGSPYTLLLERKWPDSDEIGLRFGNQIPVFRARGEISSHLDLQSEWWKFEDARTQRIRNNLPEQKLMPRAAIDDSGDGACLPCQRNNLRPEMGILLRFNVNCNGKLEGIKTIDNAELLAGIRVGGVDLAHNAQVW